MKKISPLFIILFSFVLSGQPTTSFLKGNIENVKTSVHLNIPGTRLNIIPPQGFYIAKTFKGLQKDKTTIINVSDSIGDNFYEFDLAGMKASYTKLGAKVLNEKTITVQGYPGKYMMMQASPNTQTHLLVFGDNDFCTTIITVYPVIRPETGDEIITSLNTICYEKERKIYPLDTAGFSFNENITPLKYFGFNSQSHVYAYTIQGKEDKMDGKNPFVLITKLPVSDAYSLEAIAEVANKMNISKYELNHAVKKGISVQKINGANAYQLDTYGQINNTNSIIYNCVISNGKKTFLLHGVSKTDVPNSLLAFKKLASSFVIQQ